MILFLSFSFSNLIAQSGRVVDLSGEQKEYLSNLFYASTQARNRFINGSVYQDAYIRAKGHQFFQSENWHTGNLVMRGKPYDSISLRYDIYKDQLLYSFIHELGAYTLALNKTRIESFSIDDHHFLHLDTIHGTNPRMRAGFYEVVSTGKASYFIKWRKRYDEPSQISPGAFVLSKDWYILNDNRFYKITRKPGLIRALKDRESEIKTYMLDNHILIGSGDEAMVKKVVDYYNNLQQERKE